MTRILLILPVFIVISGCGLIGPGPGGETAPLLFGFQEAVALLPAAVPTDPLGLLSWVVGLGAAVAAGIGGTIHQGRKIKRLSSQIVKNGKT